MIMSTIASDEDDCSFSNLLCAEDSSVLSVDVDSSPLTESSSDFDSTGCGGADQYEEEEESIAGLIEVEEYFSPGFEYSARFRSDDCPSDESSLDASARAHSISWMLKVRAFYGFQAVTAYLAVNYLDRFLCSHRLPQTKGWPLQLLSVACMSLAAKMEEPLVPSLLDLQVEDASHIFEPKTIQRMELLVLTILEWRLRSVTPFSFISLFAYKLDPTETFTCFLISRASDVILSSLQETSLLEYRSSSIAAASVLCAGSEISIVMNPEDVETWCNGLSKEKVINCYRVMKQCLVGRRCSGGTICSPLSKALPQFRVMSRTRACRVRSSSFDYYDLSLSSSLSSPSSYSSTCSSTSSTSSLVSIISPTTTASNSSSSLVTKRRRLNYTWSSCVVDDDCHDKGNALDNNKI